MKILATGDWHIGKVSHGYARAEEHRHFLNWLKEQAAMESCVAVVANHDPDVQPQTIEITAPNTET